MSSNFLFDRRSAGLSLNTWLFLALAAAAPLVGCSSSPYNADTGFRPGADGFSFANYGSETPTTNLDVQRMRELFGDRVCATQPSPSCKLTPPANKWRSAMNSMLDSGHCEGMVVLSALLYKKSFGYPVSALGAATTSALSLTGNEKLQTEIAKWSATQLTPTTFAALLGAGKSPSQMLELLQQMWRAGDMPALRMSRVDALDAHSVLPYRMVDNGGGQVSLMVYDPDYPKAERTVAFDLNREEWVYEFFLDKSGSPFVYQGNVTSENLGLVPISGRVGKLDCPFCKITGSQSLGDNTSQLFMDPATNPFAVATETCPAGYQNVNAGEVQQALDWFKTQREMGRMPPFKVCPESPIPKIACSCETERQFKKWDDMFHSYNGAPGTQADKDANPNKWTAKLPSSFVARRANQPGVPPVLHFMSGAPSFLRLERLPDGNTPSSLSITGAGYDLSIFDVLPSATRPDMLLLSAGGNSLSFDTNAAVTPELTVGFESDGADFELALIAHGSPNGMAATVEKDEAKGTFSFVVSDVPTYDLFMRREDAQGEAIFSHMGEAATAYDRIIIQYGTWKGNDSPLTIQIDHGNDGTIDETLELSDQDAPLEKTVF